MPVRVFHQEHGRFVERTREVGLGGSSGWWNAITVADVNGDGRPDLILGNLGLNSYLKASAKEPARLYVGAFGNAGTTQSILTSYRNGASYPVGSFDDLARAIPSLRERYPTYGSFGMTRVEDIVPAPQLEHAGVLQATDFASAVAVNRGNGTFALERLPAEAQLSPVFAALSDDFEGSGGVDLLLAGNEFGAPPIFGRYDASYGLLLHGTGAAFQPIDGARSGLTLDGQVRHMKLLHQAGGGLLVVIGTNDDKLQILRVTTTAAK